MDPVTRLAFSDVQQRLDWVRPRRFEVKAAREGRCLRIEGVDAEALPPGSYEIKVRVGGLRLEPSAKLIRIPEGGSVRLRLREKQAKLSLRLNRTVEEFDVQSRRIVENSKLDCTSALDWLEHGKHRDRRKACLLNILAKLAAAPTPRNALNRFVDHVFLAEMDRIYCAVSPEFHTLVRRTFGADSVVHPSHQRLLSRIPSSDGRDGDGYRLRSYREPSASSLQIVVAEPAGGNGAHYADMDIDRGNPGWDLRSFLIHVGELLDPRKTNHLKLRGRLAKGATADFVYYDVESC
jgi:hypothetical protein